MQSKARKLRLNPSLGGMSRYEPKDLAAVVEAAANSVGTRAFITANSNKRLREMWCAAKFGMGYAKNVAHCLIDISEVDEGREFDFYLCVGNERLPFQVAEVLDKDRRRGDDYRRLTSDEINDLHNHLPWQDHWYAGRRICDELKAKALRYGSVSKSLHMLLYLNVKASSLSWASLANAAEVDSNAFASVWLITQDLICCIHSGSRWSGLVGWKLIEDAV